MKAIEWFHFVLVFPFIMWMASLIGVSSFVGGYADPNNYLATFVVNLGFSALMSFVGGFVLNVFLSVNPVQLFVYVSFSTVVLGFFLTGMSHFDAIVAVSPVAVAFMTIVKVLLTVVILFASYKLLYGEGFN